MSHKATSWLATLLAEDLGHTEFRVLFHLCDCHNPSLGCFPTQAYLVEMCGMSRSTVNVALGSLEEKGLIKRHASIDERTRRQRPTRYILGFEMGATQEPCPKSGHGNPESEGGAAVGKPCPADRTRAVSDLDAKPCPAGRKSRVRIAGHKPVNEPVNNQRAGAGGDHPAGHGLPPSLALLAEKLAKGGYVPSSAVRPDQARQMLTHGVVTEADLKRHGIAF